MFGFLRKWRGKYINVYEYSANILSKDPGAVTLKAPDRLKSETANLPGLGEV